MQSVTSVVSLEKESISSTSPPINLVYFTHTFGRFFARFCSSQISRFFPHAENLSVLSCSSGSTGRGKSGGIAGENLQVATEVSQTSIENAGNTLECAEG